MPTEKKRSAGSREVLHSRLRIRKRRSSWASIFPTLRVLCMVALLAALGVAGFKYATQPFSVDALEFSSHVVGTQTASVGVLGTAAGDTDGDGDIDIVTAGNDGIKVYIQNENKSFEQKVIDDLDGERAILADFNNDGRVDILVGLKSSPGVKWYRNDENNEFSGSFIGSGSQGKIAAGDIDQDGNIDVITATKENELIVLRRWMNDGDGVFTSTTLDADSGVTAVTVGDVNGNQYPDIVIGGLNGLQRWDTSNGLSWNKIDLDEEKTEQTHIAVGDVNDDNKTDIVTGNQGSNVVIFYRNLDNSAYERIQLDGDADATTVQIKDIEEDGDEDIIVAAQDDNSIYWFKNDGSETFTKHTLATNLQSVFSVTVVDIDDDNDFDFVTGDHFRGTVFWYERVRVKPVASAPTNIRQSTNGSGIVTFDTTLSDADYDATRIRVQYSKDGENWDKPWITKVTPAAGSVDLKNSNGYQIGTTNPIDTNTNDSVKITITWDTKSVENTGGPIVGDVGTVQLRIIPRDVLGNGLTVVSSKFRVDNKVPDGLASFRLAAIDSSQATLAWSKPADSSTFAYSLYYGTDADAVQAKTSDALTVESNPELGDIDTTSVIAQDLEADKTYSFKLFVKDAYGNETASPLIKGITTTSSTAPVISPTPTSIPGTTPTPSATPLTASPTPLFPSDSPGPAITPSPTPFITPSPTPPLTTQNNVPPQADAGIDQVVNPSALVILDGTASTDVDNDPLVYNWRQLSGPKVTILSDRTATPSFSAGGENETYIFSLTVRDPRGASATDSVTVATRALAQGKAALVDVDKVQPEPIVTEDAGGIFIGILVRWVDLALFGLALMLTLVSLLERLVRSVREKKNGYPASEANDAPKGKVVHYKTGEAIAGAQVLIYGSDGKLRLTERTNDRGEFATLFPAGEYTIRIQADGFTFAPMSSSAMKPESGILYTGGKLTVQDGSKPVAIVIPMKPAGQEVTSISIRFLHTWQTMQRLGRVMSWPVFLLGALLNTGLIFWMPNGLYLTIEVLYVVLVIVKVALEIRVRPAYGFVRDAITHIPLDLAVVRLYEQGTNRLIMTRVTNTQGKFFALPPAGTYTITITKPGYGVFSKQNVVITSEQDSALQITSDLMPVMPSSGLMQARAAVL